ncbi:hypothetical protein [Microbacterium sp. NPDC055455]
MWSWNIYHTQTGVHELALPEAAAGSFDTRVTGKGSGDHSFVLYGAGISQADVREFTKGNKYTITQEWDGVVCFAGVIQGRRYVKRSRVLQVRSAELRGAYLNDRMLFGVPEYEVNPSGTVLTVLGKSHAGAARAVLDAATNQNAEWAFPLDLPSDGSGGFSASWTYDDRLKVEDHLQQIEDDGAEVFLRPYKSSGNLRWQAHVGAPALTIGTATTLDVDASDSPILDLEVDDDYVKQMTGVLAFGEGGRTAISKFAPTVGTGATDMGVRDTWVSFPDITSESRLQAAATATYNALKVPTSAWDFGLHVYPDGPAYALPGRLLTLSSLGDEFIPDGDHALRVVGLRGGVGFTVTPEVQVAS